MARGKTLGELMRDSDSYILQAFLRAPKTILGGIFLFIAAVLFGEIVFLVCENGGLYFYTPFDFLFDLLFSFGFGAMSGVGLIFLGIDFWFIYRLMYNDETGHNFFFVIAANQIAISMCSMLVMGGIIRAIPGLIISSILLGLLYWGTRKLRAKLIQLGW